MSKLTEIVQRCEALFEDLHCFRGVAAQPLNNAVLMHYLIYLKNLPLFEALYEAEGENLARFVEAIREPVKRGEEPFAVVQSLLDDKRSSAATERPSVFP